jgi:hypothetical protein
VSDKRFEGRPCKRGHTTRYVSSRECVACIVAKTRAYTARFPERTRAARRAYYAKNPVKWRAASKRWAKANPEKIRAQTARAPKGDPVKAIARSRAWYADNKGRAKARNGIYRKEHPEMRRAECSRRRALKRNAPGRGVTTAQWRQMLADSMGLCAYCNERSKLTIDHIEPLSRGGEHDVSNTTAVCKGCNSSKCDTPLLVWLAERAA